MNVLAALNILRRPGRDGEEGLGHAEGDVVTGGCWLLWLRVVQRHSHTYGNRIERKGEILPSVDALNILAGAEGAWWEKESITARKRLSDKGSSEELIIQFERSMYV